MSTGQGKPGERNSRAIRAASRRRSEVGTIYADGGWYRVRTAAEGGTEILYQVAELATHPEDVRSRSGSGGEGAVVVTYHFLETDAEEEAVLAALQAGDVPAALAVTRG